MTHLKLALDWTPNINHIGIFIAKEIGFYKENGIDLEIISPLFDNYSLTPGKKLELGLADFAIAPFETVISLNNKENQFNAIAIFAILQEDISSIASQKPIIWIVLNYWMEKLTLPTKPVMKIKS
jgi:ABC-type nitrate/sulfonate/bicarbonate transport system substrate-binding protein